MSLDWILRVSAFNIKRARLSFENLGARSGNSIVSREAFFFQTLQIVALAATVSLFLIETLQYVRAAKVKVVTFYGGFRSWLIAVRKGDVLSAS